MCLPDPAPAVSYPPAPWHTCGGAWIGLFRADQAVPVPPDLKPLLGARWLVVALIRHLAGTLRYDELIVGALVRRGAHPGLHVHAIWVDSRASQASGHHIWGLPKVLARFDWRDSTVQIADADGLVATLHIDPRTALLPRLPVAVPVFGERSQRRLRALALASARLGRAGLRVAAWSERFPYRVGARPLFAVAMKPFDLVVHPPRTLDGTGGAAR
ncbi:MAG TPA: acetoacetate decarboxylase family protein [Herpetosiphonaceae bacterium]